MAVTATGTCTITRLRNGDIIYATFTFSRATSVAYDGDTILGGFDEEPLSVGVQFTSASGRPISLVSGTAVWTVEGGLVEEFEGFSVDQTDGTLNIPNNDFMDAKNPRNHIFNLDCEVSVGGVRQNVSKSFEVTMISSGGNSYWGTIVPKGSTVLSNENENVMLEPSLRKGGEIVSPSDYKVLWFNNNNQVTKGIIDKKLSVTRDIVDGAALIRCEFYSLDDVFLEADGITVLDVADEYQIVLNSEYQVDIRGEISIEPKLYSATQGEFVGNAKWTAEVRNNYTLAKVTTGWMIDAETGTFTMRESNMYYQPTADDANYIGDGKRVEYNPIVIFTAKI